MKRKPQATGIIDEDPLAHPGLYVKSMSTQIDAHDVLQLAGKQGRRIIMLRPRLEEWVIKSTRASHLSMKDYGLPGNGADLHDLFGEYPRQIDRLARLVKDLLPISRRVQLVQQML